MNVHWDIRREGRAWTADEFRLRRELLPEKLEVDEGKLLWCEEDRIKLLGLLLENVGADEAVRLGDPNVWIGAALNRPRPFLGDRFNRWMLLLLCLHVAVVAAMVWWLPYAPAVGPRVAGVVLGVVVGSWTYLGLRLFLDD